MLKLKLQYFVHLKQIVDSLEKSMTLGKAEDRSRRESQRMRWVDGIPDSMDMNFSKLWEMGRDREAWRAAVCEVSLGDRQTTYDNSNKCKNRTFAHRVF